MAIDPDNAVAKLCAHGMEAEGAGRFNEAKALFEQAWETAGDDYERCIAAHYLARHQDGPQEILRWNAACLRRADCAGDARVAGCYPSLYLTWATFMSSSASDDRPSSASAPLRRISPPCRTDPTGTWSETAFCEGLQRPACQGSVLPVPSRSPS